MHALMIDRVAFIAIMRLVAWLIRRPANGNLVGVPMRMVGGISASAIACFITRFVSGPSNGHLIGSVARFVRRVAVRSVVRFIAGFVGRPTYRNLIWCVTRLVRGIAIFTKMLLIAWFVDRVFLHDIVGFTNWFANGVAMISVMLLIYRTVTNTFSGYHDRAIDGPVTNANAIFLNGLVTDLVLYTGRANLRGRAAIHGIVACATICCLCRLSANHEGREGGNQRQDILKPHLWPPPATHS